MNWITAPQAVLIGLALTCFTSFSWAILRFFRQAQGMPARMKLISLTGSLSMVSHLVGLSLFYNADAIRFRIASTLYLISLALFWWAIRAASKDRLNIAFSDQHSSRLVTNGPYRFLRHPIYASYLWAWTAGAVAIVPWWGWIPFAVMGWQYLSAIRFEERQFLSGPLADEYQAYSRRTYRLLLGLY